MPESWTPVTRPELIERLFLDACVDGLEGTARLGERTVLGRFGWPDEPARVVFRTATPARVGPEERLSIEFRSATMAFRFHTRIHRAQQRELHLVRPRRVEVLERRREPRVPVGQGFQWHCDQADLHGTVVDLSRSGLALLVDEPPTTPLHRSLSGWLELPGSQPLATEVRLANRRVTDDGVVVGLEVVEMTPEGRHLLGEAVLALLAAGEPERA